MPSVKANFLKFAQETEIVLEEENVIKGLVYVSLNSLALVVVQVYVQETGIVMIRDSVLEENVIVLQDIQELSVIRLHV